MRIFRLAGANVVNRLTLALAQFSELLVGKTCLAQFVDGIHQVHFVHPGKLKDVDSTDKVRQCVLKVKPIEQEKICLACVATRPAHHAARLKGSARAVYWPGLIGASVMTILTKHTTLRDSAN